MKTPPFFYKVSFHFLANDNNNEITHENWAKEFIDPNPYKAREEAFIEFNEYLQFLKSNDRLETDEYGNPKITSPSGIPEKTELPDNLDEMDDTGFRKFIREQSKFVEFEENLDVLLVISDEELLEALNEVDNTFTIYSVSSNPLALQYIMDNLRFEFGLYYECNLKPHDNANVVQHYGEDYAESGEEEGAENYAILPTPMKWSSREIYDKKNNEEVGWEQNKPKSLWENIIQGGESNSLEFKPSLIYNFLPDTPNHIPRFNNAKTICGFLNARGGVLLIGISDDGVPEGIDEDFKYLGSRDKIKLNIDKLIYSYFGDPVVPLIKASFERIKEKEVIAIKVQPSNRPVFLKNYNPNTGKTTKHFFARRNASTTEIRDVEEIIDYVFNHWSKQ
jgi:hypothetical protein